jgi:hypothetical protein
MKTKKISNVNFSVFQTRIALKTYYICLSGGELRNGEVFLTEIGTMALEALAQLPTPFERHVLEFQEVRIGKIPLRKKIKQMLLSHPNHSKVCLFGDMAGELDGVIIDALNLIGSTEIKMPNDGRNFAIQTNTKISRADKLAQLKASQHDPLFMADLQAINADFADIDKAEIVETMNFHLGL